VFAWKRLIFPDPVTENLFLALEWVFIFGIIVFFQVTKIEKFNQFPIQCLLFFSFRGNHNYHTSSFEFW
jgi:hypothetical protein